MISSTLIITSNGNKLEAAGSSFLRKRIEKERTKVSYIEMAI